MKRLLPSLRRWLRRLRIKQAAKPVYRDSSDMQWVTGKEKKLMRQAWVESGMKQSYMDFSKEWWPANKDRIREPK